MDIRNDAPTSQLVVFLLGSEEYGLPIRSVQEVIRYQQPRAVASSDSTLLGVINLRGQIVPVHDVRKDLGMSGDRGEAEKIVLVSAEGAMAGIVVDDVLEVLNVDVGEFEDLPAAGNRIVEGVVKSGERLIILLDPFAVTGLSDGGDAAAA
ncbi:MAG TPA: chemotaxis protein CheW [Solirubrobacterales bacterium]|jgi:purine-binding chemotaxis protein CheW|nr:chemotaxis protein CheW [Solirubrobacterales bacterium]